MEGKHVIYRAVLTIPIICACLLLPVTVYALLSFGRPSPTLPPLGEALAEVPTEELTKLDTECRQQLQEAFGADAQEGLLPDAV